MKVIYAILLLEVMCIGLYNVHWRSEVTVGTPIWIERK